ncbi:MAG TPA: hypothetical protein PLF21_07125 [Exilispira sp.]|nr:hypothetical protein [Exilispira sp.]
MNFSDYYILYPNAKLNLNLFIGEKEKTWWTDQQGNPLFYHRLLSVMVPINLYDRMIIKPGRFKVEYVFKKSSLDNSFANSSIDYFNNDLQKSISDNCIIKKVIEKFNLNEDKIDYEITIEKNIPLASGLGGGSSNAAFFIKFLMEKGIIKFKSQKELLRKTCEIGSDVPFFFINSPSIVSGFGEKITLIKNFNNLIFVIFQPFKKISTQLMYSELDNISNRKIINKKFEKKMIKKFKKNLQNTKNYVSSLSEIANNDFELIVSKKYDEFDKWKLLFKGSLFAQISGAGSSIFGVFSKYQDAKNCYENLKNIHGRVYICSCKI